MVNGHGMSVCNAVKITNGMSSCNMESQSVMLKITNGQDVTHVMSVCNAVKVTYGASRCGMECQLMLSR